MAPVYSLDCPECCPPCDYNIFVRVEHYPNGDNVIMFYFYAFGNLNFFSVGNPNQIDETNGNFSTTLQNGASADYSSGSVVLVYGDKTITFTNLTTNSGTTSANVKWWEISSNTCSEA